MWSKKLIPWKSLPLSPDGRMKACMFDPVCVCALNTSCSAVRYAWQAVSITACLPIGVYVSILAVFMQSHWPRVILCACVFHLGHLVWSHFGDFDHCLHLYSGNRWIMASAAFYQINFFQAQAHFPLIHVWSNGPADSICFAQRRHERIISRFLPFTLSSRQNAHKQTRMCLWTTRNCFTTLVFTL